MEKRKPAFLGNRPFGDKPKAQKPASDANAAVLARGGPYPPEVLQARVDMLEAQKKQAARERAGVIATPEVVEMPVTKQPAEVQALITQYEEGSGIAPEVQVA